MDEERVVQLETMVAFARDDIERLNAEVAERDRALLALEQRVQTLEHAVRMLVARSNAPPEDDDETDVN